jgi:hypothetical protein
VAPYALALALTENVVSSTSSAIYGELRGLEVQGRFGTLKAAGDPTQNKATISTNFSLTVHENSELDGPAPPSQTS